LRDRALVGLMDYSFAHVGVALGITVGDLYTQEPPGVGVAAREGRQAPRRGRATTYSRDTLPRISTARAHAAIYGGRCSPRFVAAPPAHPHGCFRRQAPTR
jgi:hypothetical protein